MFMRQNFVYEAKHFMFWVYYLATTVYRASNWQIVAHNADLGPFGTFRERERCVTLIDR